MTAAWAGALAATSSIQVAKARPQVLFIDLKPLLVALLGRRILARGPGACQRSSPTRSHADGGPAGSVAGSAHGAGPMGHRIANFAMRRPSKTSPMPHTSPQLGSAR